MKLGRYFRYCFLRSHRWVNHDGQLFLEDWCTTNCDEWRDKCRGYSTCRYEKRPAPAKRSKGEDRVCADCEKVELNETAPVHREEVAAHKLRLIKSRARTAKELEVQAAKSGPHERTLSPAEKEIEDYVRRSAQEAFRH